MRRDIALLLCELKKLRKDLNIGIRETTTLISEKKPTSIIAIGQWDLENMCKLYVEWTLPDEAKTLADKISQQLIRVLEGLVHGQGVKIAVFCSTDESEKPTEISTSETKYRLLQSFGKCAVYIPIFIMTKLELALQEALITVEEEKKEETEQEEES